MTRVDCLHITCVIHLSRKFSGMTSCRLAATRARDYPIINLKDSYFEPAVRTKISHACADIGDIISHLKKLTYPTPGGFRGLPIQCASVGPCVVSLLNLASSARWRSVQTYVHYPRLCDHRHLRDESTLF